MMTLLLIVLFLILIAFMYILFKNIEMKEFHAEKMDKLRGLIFSLHQQQEALNAKISISNQYEVNYKKEIKALGEEIVVLQKVFVEIISNQKNK